MKFGKFLLFSLLCFAWSLQAQDIHFTMFNMSPLTVNPAHTGAFLGTIRIGGIYRSQWNSSLGGDGYSTPSVYADSPFLAVGKKKRDWLGIGVAIVQDNAGTNGLKTNSFLLSGAFHKTLDKKGDHVLTLGIHQGNFSRQIDDAEVLTEQGIIDGGRLGFVGGGEDIDDSPKTFRDFAGGLMIKSAINEKTNLTLGSSFFYITQPDQSLVTFSQRPDTTSMGGGSGKAPEGNNQKPSLINAHGAVAFQATDKWTVEPSAIFRITKGLTETILQGNAGYKFNDNLTFLMGAGYRFGDAAHLIGGVDYQGWKVLLSYDFTTSPLANDGRIRNGFEIAAQYIIKVYKQPQVDPAILCPKF